MNTLSHYVPSPEMWKALQLEFSDVILGKNDPTFADYLQSLQLNYENVCSVLTTLLNIEDISTMQLYGQLKQSNVKITKTKRGQSRISGSTKSNYSMLSRYVDNVFLLPPGTLPADASTEDLAFSVTGTVYEITNVFKTGVIIRSKLGSKSLDAKKLVNQSFDAFFRSPRIPFRLMYRALNVLESTPHARRYLFPLPNTQAVLPGKLASFPLLNKDIANNPEQLQAVQQIVAGPNPNAPYIVFGPPGTGKTTTVVEAILQLYLQQKCHILVAAGSNSACDTIALALIQCIEKDPRFVTLSNDLEHVLLRLVSYTRFKTGGKTMHESVLRYSNYESMRERQNNKRGKGLKQFELENYGIIVATLCTASIRARHCPDRFTHIFIDEAASSSEAETMLAIADIKGIGCHVILSGDHKQLGPVIKHKRAKALGLGGSLMKRLMLHPLYEVDSSGNYDRTLQSRLRRNYRSHPEIVGIYNKLYYNSELIPVVSLAQVNHAEHWSKLPNGQFPILFQATHGSMESEENSTSSYNALEAQVVCWYVTSLLTDGLGDVRVEEQDIGVMTPYLGQCKLLKYLLRKKQRHQVNVGTVESYQGREKPIIIASLVSSYKRTTFISNPRRVNVMLSRPKVLLVLIGNPFTLSQNDDFKFIVDQCTLKGNMLYKAADLTDGIIEGLKELKLDEVEDEDGCSDSDS